MECARVSYYEGGRRGRHHFPFSEAQVGFLCVEADRRFFEHVFGGGNCDLIEPFEFSFRVDVAAFDEVQGALFYGCFVLVDPDLISGVERVYMHIVLRVPGDVRDGAIDPFQWGNLSLVESGNHHHNFPHVILSHRSEVFDQDAVTHERFIVGMLVVPPLSPPGISYPFGQQTAEEVEAHIVECFVRDVALV
eukprot:CAMPEP_0197515972 /NCGR_PEP_ID=MMETSP1318-20131121/911_1 /TAXON_ID=552666 /ORGANISM="Partenskyella glossopodia, Strain RCC365" /LENGTH=191 /DNA_ID=CAMNT_0043064463 /DNA_START=380 /DNA_END=955 /DNA_ORIENTATION=+